MAETLLGETSALSASELLSQVEALKSEVPPSAILCRGPDAVSLLALLLPLHFKRVFKRDISPRAQKQTTGNELKRALRMAFEFAHFAVTMLFTRIRKWESENTSFRIIKEFSV